MTHQPHAAVSPRPAPRARRRLLAAACAAAVLSASAGLVLTRPATAVGALAVQAAEASPGAVYTRQGQVFEGSVTEGPEEVQITTNGIVTRIPREDVLQVEYGTRGERLAARLDALPPDAEAERLALGRRALSSGLFDLAQRAAESVQQVNPNSREAQALAEQVQRQRQVDRQAGQGTRRSPAQAGGDAPEAADDDAAASPRRPGRGDEASLPALLTDEQVNRIKQLELQPADSRGRLRINFRDNAIRRFTETQDNLDFRQFNRLGDVEKAMAIIAEAPEEIRRDVIVTNDPGSILEYRRTIQPAVLNNCTVSGCHGGNPQTGFNLRRDVNAEAASYTNFHALTTYARDYEGGSTAFGGDGKVLRNMIDRSTVEDSLLLNYLLPADQSRYDHPPVEGWNGIVQSRQDPIYVGVAQWINSLRRPAPDYDFRPGEGAPADAAADPATRPAE